MKIYPHIHRIVLFLYRKIGFLNKTRPTLPQGIRSFNKAEEENSQILLQDYHFNLAERISPDVFHNKDLSSFTDLHYPAIKLYTLNRIRVLINKGYMINMRDKGLYKNSLFLETELIKGEKFFFSLKKQTGQKEAGPASFIYAWNNYYHFYFDFIFRYLILSQYKKDIKIYCNKFVSNWQYDVCKIFGIDTENILFIDSNEEAYLDFNNYFFISFPGLKDFGFADIKAIQYLNPKIDIKKKESPERIFIGRNQAIHRKMVNEAELKTLLEKKYNFTSIQPEKLSVIEQAELFSNARQIIAIHGAALTNIIYASNANIIEIMHERSNPYCFASLAVAKNCSYNVFKCKGIQNPKLEFNNFEDIIIDIESFDLALSKHLL